MNLKHLSILLFVSLFLSTCSEQTLVSEPTSTTSVETTDTKSFIVDDITTTFYPKVTNLPVLTTEEEELLNELNDRVNSEFDGEQMTSEEMIQSIAHEYNREPEELLTLYERGNEVLFYRGVGNQVITNVDWIELMHEVLETNIIGDIERNMNAEAGGNRSDDHTGSKFVGSYFINGEEYYIAIFMEYSDDFETAELVRLVIDGEDIDLN